jgi:uncharacterized protein (UPF0276 family)
MRGPFFDAMMTDPIPPPMPPTTVSIALRAGIGLRPAHYQAMLAERPAVSFLEVHSENFFGDGGQPLKYLARFREDYPISTHGVGLSLGSTDPLDRNHLRKLKRLVDAIDPVLVSEHLCWVGVNGRFLNDLLPLPYTPESLEHVVCRIGELQDFLQRPVLIENVSSYLEFVDSTIPEWEFVREVASRAGCQILLDANNIYVNAVNHDFDALTYLDTIVPASVGEIHLGGFQDTGELLIDTHGAAVCDEVWALYQYAVTRFGPVPTLIEWDTDIPALGVLLAEADKANQILAAHRQEVSRVA